MRLKSLPHSVSRSLQKMLSSGSVEGQRVDRTDVIDRMQARLKAVGTVTARRVYTQAADRGLQRPKGIAKRAGERAAVAELKLLRLRLLAHPELERAHLTSKAKVKQAYDHSFAVEREHGLMSPQAHKARAQLQAVATDARQADEKFFASLEAGS